MLREKSLPVVYTTLVFLLSACATAANGASRDDAPKGVEKFAEDPRLGEQTDRLCFASSVDNFHSATRDTVVLDVSPSKSYLVEVTNGCFNLDRAMSMTLDTVSGCATRGDYLIVSDSAFGLSQSSGLGPDRCLIRSIYEWDEDAAEDQSDDEAATEE